MGKFTLLLVIMADTGSRQILHKTFILCAHVISCV